MGKKIKNITPRPNQDAQISAMKALFPFFTSRREGKNLIFTGTLQVSEYLPPYRIKAVYRGSARPHIYIICPKLRHNAPHVYKEGYLCLYHDDNIKWNTQTLLAEKIMRWVPVWIYFYEFWLQTGDWIGPEVPHIGNKSDNESNTPI